MGRGLGSAGRLGRRCRRGAAVFAAALILGAAQVGVGAEPPGTLTTFAGGGTGGDGVQATSAALRGPTDIARGPDGSVFIADRMHHRIRRVAPDGVISTVAGTGVNGFSGDGGPATSARLYYPTGIDIDATGNLYIADQYNHRVRKVTPGGTISTVAGTGATGFTGDNGPATSARLSLPTDVAVGSSGNLLISDRGNRRIRSVAAGGTISTVVGTGGSGFAGDGGPAAAATLSSPRLITRDAAGNLYIADAGHGRIRRVDAFGTITTVAGGGTLGDGGLAVTASLRVPTGVGIDPDGALLIAEQSANRIRRVAPDGTISTVAGQGSSGFTFATRLAGPTSVLPDEDGGFLFADQYSGLIRSVSYTAQVPPPPPVIIVFDHPASFVGTTGAVVGANFPTNLGAVPEPYVEGGLSFSNPLGGLYVGAYGFNQSYFESQPGWTNLLTSPNQLAFQGTENLDIVSGVPLGALGFEFVEPETNTNVGTAGTFEDSTFEISLWSGTTLVASLLFEPENDVATFFGVTSSVAFDRFSIREIIGDIENEFVGTIYVAARPASPPHATVASHADGAVVGGTTIDLVAAVAHSGAAIVTSVPAGVFGEISAGGGTIEGTLPLDGEDGPYAIAISTQDAFGNIGGTSVEVIRDTTAPVVEVTSPAAGAVVGMGPIDVTVQVADLTATTIDVAGVAAALDAGGGSVTVSVALAAGLNDLAIVVTDAAGHATTVHHTVVFDVDAPVVTIDAPASGSFVGTSPVAVTATIDDVSATTVTSTPDGVSGALPPGGGVLVGAIDLVEGPNLLTVTATDQAGLEGSASVTVHLDTTGPSVAFAAPHDGAAVRGQVDVSVTADDGSGSGVATLVVTIDGEPLLGGTLDTSPLDDGPHVLAAVATDVLGNASAPVSLTIHVDNTPPVVQITAPADGALVAGVVPFTVHVTDAGSGVVAAGMKVAGQAPSTDASAAYDPAVAEATLEASDDTSLRPDGATPFTATARDAAGNEATASITVTLDNSNPASNLLQPLDGSVVAGTIALEGAADDPHLASLTLLVDGVEVATSATSPIAASFDTTTKLDGPMTVELHVTDAAGNTSVAAAHVWVDNVAFTLTPAMLHLKTKGSANAPVDANLRGPNLALLLPTEAHAIVLRIPGGNDVPAVQGWDGDDALSGTNLDQLKLRFSRAAVVASIQAGIAAEQIDAASRQVVVTLLIDGRPQGTTVLAFSEGK